MWMGNHKEAVEMCFKISYGCPNADTEKGAVGQDALVRDEWSASLPCRFTPGEKAPGTLL
jgi:hypothetical protein